MQGAVVVGEADSVVQAVAPVVVPVVQLLLPVLLPKGTRMRLVMR